MASAKLQKPDNEACSKAHQEHRFSHKISEMTAKVFGHKQQEPQAVTKHCNTCQCAATKDPKPAITEKNKKEHATTIPVNKDAKHNSCMELRRKEKQHITNTVTKDAKQAPSSEMKKNEMKEQQAKSNINNASNTTNKKEHKGEPTNHFFSSMADHWKEKIKMMKKTKDVKSKDSSDSSSSSSDSEDEACEKKKKDKKHHHGTKATPK